jgi:hypothetical protein
MGAPMFGTLLQDFELKPLRKILELELTGYPADSQEALWKLTEITFDRWKRECSKQDDYTGNAFARLLGKPASDEELAQAEPWLCAGFGVRCRTELAFKLWLEDYPPFKQVLDTAGLGRLFALLASREDATNPAAIIRVAGMLMDMRIWTFARYYEKASQKEQKKLATLASGRKKGANAQKAKAEEKIRAMRDYVRSYFMSKPAASYDDAVREVLARPYGLKANGTRYSARHVLEVIAGVKDEALKALGTARQG